MDVFLLCSHNQTTYFVWLMYKGEFTYWQTGWSWIGWKRMTAISLLAMKFGKKSWPAYFLFGLVTIMHCSESTRSLGKILQIKTVKQTTTLQLTSWWSVIQVTLEKSPFMFLDFLQEFQCLTCSRQICLTETSLPGNPQPCHRFWKNEVRVF